MEKYKEYLKKKGYKISGEIATLLNISFRICNGNINTAMGTQKTYWLELL